MGMTAWVPQRRGVPDTGGFSCAQEAVSMQQVSDVVIPGFAVPPQARAQAEFLALICMELA